MITKRLDALDIGKRRLFTAIYGVHSEAEVFVTKDLRLLDFHEALYLYLRQEGYITVFCDNNKVWSYEEKMLLQFLNLNVQQEEQEDNDWDDDDDFFAGKGPMHEARAEYYAKTKKKTPITHNPAISLIEAPKKSRYYAHFNTIGLFGKIYALTERFPDRKVAVVFANPNTLEYNEAEQKIYEDQLVELQTTYVTRNIGLKLIALYNYGWGRAFDERYKEDYSNKFLFRSPFKDWIDMNREDLHGELPESLFFLSDPQEDEISNILNRRRLLEDGLYDIFGHLEWDKIVRRLWQNGLPSKTSNNKEITLRLIKDFKNYPIQDLNELIRKMDTNSAQNKLNSLLGIDKVRKQFEDYLKAFTDSQNINSGAKFRPHMALMGNPGTGKTTVARLFGEILKEKGLLEKGHFVKVDVSELIGEYVGSTRPKTRAVCERAKGGVLFIDEAYGLMSGHEDRNNGADYGKEAIEVLIQFMEEEKKSLVVFAGYTKEIKQLINEGNLGFRSRFNDLGLFEFDDYEPEVLFQIAQNMLNDVPVKTTSAFDNALRIIVALKYAYRNKKFGNVREMENLVNKILSAYSKKDGTEDLDMKHLPDDLKILVDQEMLDRDNMLEELDAMIGQSKVKQAVENLFYNCKTQREMMQYFPEREPELPKLNFIFTGNPGTGKTTIARIIGKILQDIGVLTSTDASPMTEMRGAELLTYSSAQIDKLFEDNIGKVLFIDEAYQLVDNPRVIADIVGNITNEDYQSKLSVILAGYTEEMETLMRVNKGLESRFKIIKFEDYSEEDLWKILLNKAGNAKNEANRLIIDDTCKDVAMDYFRALNRDEHFGNARVVENQLIPLLKRNRDKRYRKASLDEKKNKDFMQKIIPDDFKDEQN